MNYYERSLFFGGMLHHAVLQEDWCESRGDVAGCILAFMDTCDLLTAALLYHMDDFADVLGDFGLTELERKQEGM